MNEGWNQAYFLWIGPKLSPIEQLALASFAGYGWDVTLFTYGDVAGVPSNIKLENGRTILSDDLILKDAANGAPGISYVHFSDLFRWKLLSERRGWWFDMDMVAVKSPDNSVARSPLRVGSTWEMEWAQCATNCVMYSGDEVGAAFYAEAYQAARAMVDSGVEREFCDIGPFLLQRLLREREMGAHVAPWTEFCPFPWRQIRAACASNLYEHLISRMKIVKHVLQAAAGRSIRPAFVRQNTRAVHLHNEIWRLGGLDKTGPFSRHSFLGRQLVRNGINGARIV